MSCAVILTFDEETDTRIRAAWTALADAGVTRSMLLPGVQPHLTLSAADELSDAGPVASRLAAVTSRFPVGLAGIGLFPDTGTVYATVTPRTELFDLHQRVDAACVSGPASLHDWYRPDGWMPHVTLAFGLAPAELAPAVDVLVPLALKGPAEVTGLALIRGDFDGWTEVLEFPFCREDRGE